MYEIKCPKCGETLTIDESNCRYLLSQLRKIEIQIKKESFFNVTNQKLCAFELDGYYEEVTSWGRFYVSIFNKLLTDQPQINIFPKTIAVGYEKGSRKGQYAILSNKMLLNICYSAENIVKRVKELLHWFGIDHSKCILHITSDENIVKKIDLSKVK